MIAGIPARPLRVGVSWDREPDPSAALVERARNVALRYRALTTGRVTAAVDPPPRRGRYRKLEKLMRDPRRFFADSRVRGLRPLASLSWPK